MHHGTKYSPSEGSWPLQSQCAGLTGGHGGGHGVGLHVGVVSRDGELVSPRGRVVRDGETVDPITCTEMSVNTHQQILGLECGRSGQILQDLVEICDTFLTRRHRLQIRHPS